MTPPLKTSLKGCNVVQHGFSIKSYRISFLETVSLAMA
jgi:hypothetical protein